MLPNFIGIGAARSGSTWIFRNLAKHPQIYLSRIKETHFFSQHYERGLEFYESFFELAGTARAVGEVSPEYLHESSIVAPRIGKHLPNVKLIACLRNPVDRLYSKYWNARGRFPHRKDLAFEQKLKEQPQLLREGRYVDHLARYFDHFPREQILILLYDDLEENPREFLATLYRFLEVDDKFVTDFVEHRINAATAQRLVVKNRWFYWGAKALRRMDLHRAAEWLELRNAGAIPQLPLETRRWLTDTYYRQTNEELGALLGRDLSHWNNA
jgi:hypothetical protein